MSEDTDIDIWKRKRRTTFVVYLLQNLFYGIDYTLTQSTLWVYIRKELHWTRPLLLYGVLACGRFIAPVLLGSVIGRWLDHSKQMKYWTIFLDAVSIVGYMLYALPYYSSILVVGRILQGFQYILSSLIYAEVARVYPRDEVEQQVLSLLFAQTIGYVLGPVFSELLRKTDLWIGGFHIMHGNIASLVLSSLLLIHILLTALFVHNLSKEYDLKEAEAQTHQHKSSDDTDCTSCQTETEHSALMGDEEFVSWLDILKKNFGIDAAGLVVLTFHVGLWDAILTRVLPFIVEKFRFEQVILDGCLFLESISSVIFAIILKMIKLSSNGYYYCGVLTFCILIFLDIILLVITSFTLPNAVKYIVLVVYVMSYSFHSFYGIFFVIVSIGKLFPSSHQSFIESIRNMAYLAGSLIGSVLSAYLFKHFTYVFPVCVPVAIVFITGLVVRRKTLCSSS